MNTLRIILKALPMLCYAHYIRQFIRYTITCNSQFRSTKPVLPAYEPLGYNTNEGVKGEDISVL